MIYRHCPQCFQGYETKQDFLSHLIDDYKHRYSKAAAMREWKKADREASAQETQERMAALGLIECEGCHNFIDPAQAANVEKWSSQSEPDYFCGACWRNLPDIGGWLTHKHDSYAYGFMHHENGTRSSGVSGYRSFEEAERALRKHLAQYHMNAQNNWLGAIEVIVNPADLKEHLGYVAWQKAAKQLGYTTHDCKFGDERFAAFTDAERTIERELRAQYLEAERRESLNFLKEWISTATVDAIRTDKENAT